MAKKRPNVSRQERKEIKAHVRNELLTFLRLCPPEQDATLTILRAHLLTEYSLERLIALLMPRGDKLIADGSLGYYQKLMVVGAFDVLDDKHVQALKGLNRIRNRCAHEMDATISLADVELIGRSLGHEFTALRTSYREDPKVFLHEILSSVCREISWLIYTQKQIHISAQKAYEEELKKA